MGTAETVIGLVPVAVATGILTRAVKSIGPGRKRKAAGPLKRETMTRSEAEAERRRLKAKGQWKGHRIVRVGRGYGIMFTPQAAKGRSKRKGRV